MTKKKKTLYAIILQIHSNANVFYFNECIECMKSLILIQFNPKRRKNMKKTLLLSLSLSLVFAPR